MPSQRTIASPGVATPGLLFLLLPTLALATELHVATSGRDDNDGSQARPFATIERAKAAVRTLVANGLREDVRVVIGPGTYSVTSPIEFGAEDGGDAKFSVTYQCNPHAPREALLAKRDDHTALSGGTEIGSWQVDAGGKWIAKAPNNSPIPRQLLVGGKRATRARSPNVGYHTGIVTADGLDLTFPQGTVEFNRPEGVELLTLVEWSVSRAPLTSSGIHTNADGTTLIQFPRQVFLYAFDDWAGHIRADIPKMRFYFENSAELLDVPGEWFADPQSRTIVYIPREGERPDKSRGVVPVAQSLIVVRGTAAKPVRNLHFEGFTFADTTWQVPGAGYYPVQTGRSEAMAINRGAKESPSPNAAVRFEFAHDCSLKNSTLKRLGGVGIQVAAGCKRVNIERCTLRDISHTGIEIGELCSEQPPEQLVEGTRIVDCEISECGIENEGAAGVSQLIAAGSIIAHNHVHHLPYSGITCGWNWTHEDTAARENAIEFNHIHHTQQLLADSGGIYTLGKQPGSRIVGNHIHDIARVQGLAGNNGVFQDNGSEGFHVEGNVIYAVADGPYRFNTLDTNENFQTWGKNWLGFAPDSPEFPTERAKQAGPRTTGK